jgi:hypothetical protein
MTAEARARIDSHRLMQETDVPVHEKKVDSIREDLDKIKKEKSKRWKRRALVHIFAFFISFIVATGVLMLGTLLFVKPDAPLTQLFMAGLFSLTFIASFTALRMFVMHVLINEYPNEDDDPGVSHHLVKSISYGIVALVFAIVVVGLIVNIASADII